MCNSQAEGGQRCHSHAKTALTAAETKRRTLAEQTRTLTADGQPVPTELHIQELQAGYARTDALARYASTPQGETDLMRRMDQLAFNGLTPSVYHPDIPANQEYQDYAEAISEGRRLRERAYAIRDDVYQNGLPQKEAANLTQYPSAATEAARVATIVNLRTLHQPTTADMSTADAANTATRARGAELLTDIITARTWNT